MPEGRSHEHTSAFIARTKLRESVALLTSTSLSEPELLLVISVVFIVGAGIAKTERTERKSVKSAKKARRDIDCRCTGSKGCEEVT